MSDCGCNQKPKKHCCPKCNCECERICPRCGCKCDWNSYKCFQCGHRFHDQHECFHCHWKF